MVKGGVGGLTSISWPIILYFFAFGFAQKQYTANMDETGQEMITRTTVKGSDFDGPAEKRRQIGLLSLSVFGYFIDRLFADVAHMHLCKTSG